MRHWPPLQALLVLVALGIVLFPLQRMTGVRREPVQSRAKEIESETDSVNVHAILRFAHPPRHFVVRQRDSDLWSGGDSAETEFDTDLTLQPDAGHVDLEVAVIWPPESPRTVVELELLPDGAEAQSRTDWGEGKFRAILSYPIE